MTDKEFRRLRRSELIEIIYELQTREQEHLRTIAALEEKLADRRMRLARAGSIAQAALEFSEVFERAQAAANCYLEEIQAVQEETRQEAGRILEEARLQAAALLEEARRSGEVDGHGAF